MRMSLDCAKKLQQPGDKIIAMVHYPPFGCRLDGTPMTCLFEEYSVDSVVYGHLHGKSVRAVKYMQKNGISYYLTSCDLVDNKLIRIL